jgi:hypothetical protein
MELHAHVSIVIQKSESSSKAVSVWETQGQQKHFDGAVAVVSKSGFRRRGIRH